MQENVRECVLYHAAFGQVLQIRKHIKHVLNRMAVCRCLVVRVIFAYIWYAADGDGIFGADFRVILSLRCCFGGLVRNLQKLNKNLEQTCIWRARGS
ncbi:hypothetical protein QQP08_003154 [Theobroma cacao]|nr:hypothetical protein QQP08_003154 [Theobroma cacao]